MKSIFSILFFSVVLFFQTFVLGRDLEKQTENRKKISSIWFSDAASVAKRSGNKKASKIIVFLKDSTLLGRPFKGKGGVGMVACDITAAKKRQGLCYVIPFIAEDNQIEIFSKRYINNPGMVVVFSMAMGSILLKETENISSFYRGVLLLHEGDHLVDFVRKSYDFNNNKVEYYTREVKTNSFQHKLLLESGKDAYRKILEAEKNRINSEIKNSGYNISSVIIGKGKYDFVLDKIFGACKSDLEASIRSTDLWLHAYFVLIDEKIFSPQERLEIKIKILESYYEKNLKQ